MKNITKYIIFLFLVSSLTNAKEQIMNAEDAQKVWNEYHNRIKARRLAEAKVINLELIKNSINSNADFFLDFVFFTKDEVGAKGIAKQLSENYEITIMKNGDHWLVNGTSRPYTVKLTTDQHLSWVEFMHDVALSYGCIFSTWKITEPKGNLVLSNEGIETEFD